MPRIDPLPQKGAPLAVRFARVSSRRQFGKVPAPVEYVGHAVPALLGMGAMEKALERSRVPERLRALGELRAATVVGCEYCMDIGSAVARKAGLSEQQLRELPFYGDSEVFDELEKRVLDYATAMTRTPTEVTDAHIEALREHLDDREIVELTNAIAWENWRARFNHALALDPDGFSEGAFCVTPAQMPAEVA